MTQMIDLEPAARQMTALLAGVTDDQLALATPCEKYTLGDLIEHVGGLSLAFTMAAAKEVPPGGSQGGSGDASRLGDDWRTRIPRQLGVLVEAWRDPAALEGMTKIGGIDLPGEVTAKVAANELIVHGWDIARASGQPFDAAPEAVEASLEFVSTTVGGGDESPFGAPVEVPADAPPLDRLVALTGRNPSWTP